MARTVSVAHNVNDGVWYVESSDVPGLNVEAASLDSLIEIVRELAPDLLQANGAMSGRREVELLIQHSVQAGVDRAA